MITAIAWGQALCRSVAVASLAAALGACVQQPPASRPAPPPAPPIVNAPAPGPNGCNDRAAQFAVGKAADAALLAEARTRSGAQRVRTIRPGQMVTMEFDSARLTLDVDARGVVVTVRCG